MQSDPDAKRLPLHEPMHTGLNTSAHWHAQVYTMRQQRRVKILHQQ